MFSLRLEVTVTLDKLLLYYIVSFKLNLIHVAVTRYVAIELQIHFTKSYIKVSSFLSLSNPSLTMLLNQFLFHL